MILRVGPFLYRVRFVQGYIEHEGQNCLGLCDNDAHEILISDVTGLPQQIQVICYEYMEICYRFIRWCRFRPLHHFQQFANEPDRILSG